MTTLKTSDHLCALKMDQKHAALTGDWQIGLLDAWRNKCSIRDREQKPGLLQKTELNVMRPTDLSPLTHTHTHTHTHTQKTELRLRSHSQQGRVQVHQQRAAWERQVCGAAVSLAKPQTDSGPASHRSQRNRAQTSKRRPSSILGTPGDL